VTSDHPEQCPTCGQAYVERERHDASTTIDCPTHSRICIQRIGTKFRVYRHEKITIELEGPA